MVALERDERRQFAVTSAVRTTLILGVGKGGEVGHRSDAFIQPCFRSESVQIGHERSPFLNVIEHCSYSAGAKVAGDDLRKPRVSRAGCVRIGDDHRSLFRNESKESTL